MTTLRRLLHRLFKSPMPQRELFVHEDDWGQVEVLPAACAEWCRTELARIADFASAHAAPDGAGWTDIYRRGAPPQTLLELSLPLAAPAQSLAALMPAFDAVVSGTFSAPDTVPRVRAFGPAADTAIVLVPDGEGSMLAMASLVLNGSGEARSALMRAVATLPAPSPLIVVDWQQGTIVRL